MNSEWFAKCCVVLAQIVFGLVGTDGLNYLGCFKENSINDRLLKGATKEFKRSLTPEICLSYCKTKGMRYFGLQYSYECFCSIERPSFKKIADDNECNMKCEGNPRETCGGGLRLSVYDSEEDFSTVKYMGCYKERSVTARLMAGASKDFKGTLTNQLCIQFCRDKGFSYAGTQYSFECFCTKERPHFKSAANEQDCNAPCDGNVNENCGGGLKLSVFDLYDKSSDHVYPNFLGCYENSNYQRNFLPNEEDYFKKLLTPEFCVGYCYRRGYRYAGMESGISCYCASAVDAASKVNDLQCNIPCSGDNKFKCGGREKLSVYHTEISDQSEEGRLLGCFEDSSTLRTLSGLETVFKETNTPRLCLNVCLQLGFKYAGVQYGYECFCGNRSPPRELEKPESECSMKCPGDRLRMCGGGWRLLIFSTGGGSSSKPSAAVVTQPAIVLTAATERPYTLTTTTTRRPSTLLMNAQTVRPLPNTKPQTFKPVSSLKPHTVRPTASNYPSTGGSKPGKPSYTRPSHTVISQKPTPNLTSPQSSLTTKPPKTQVTTWRPQTEQQPTLQQQTPWDNSKPQQQSPWENNKPQQQTPWDNNKPQQQTPSDNNKPQQQTPWDNNKPQQQTPWENNKPLQQTTLVTLRPPLQSTWPGNMDQLTTWGNNQPFQGGSSIQNNGRPQQQPASSIRPQTQGIVNTQQSGSSTPVNTQPTRIPTKPTCVRSVTEVRGENACKGQKIFFDDFSDSPNIDPYKWTHEAIMPWTPDYEFVVYTKNDTTSFVKNRRLYIKPSLFADDFVKRGTLDLESCTGLLHSEECRRQGATFNIIPPVQSARITTKESLSFKYGRINIRAKLPVGDWIVPEIWMEPKRKDYGSGAFASGRVRIAMARGNEILEYDGRDIGNRQLEVGILMGVGENIRARTIIRDKADGWWRSFHNYSLIWTPDNLQFLVDGQHQESLASPGQPLYQLAGFDEDLGQTWRHGSHIAPFDKEFYITLGLSVGGMRDFPDGCRSVNGHEKPWRNMAVKRLIETGSASGHYAVQERNQKPSQNEIRILDIVHEDPGTNTNDEVVFDRNTVISVQPFSENELRKPLPISTISGSDLRHSHILPISGLALLFDVQEITLEPTLELDDQSENRFHIKTDGQTIYGAHENSSSVQRLLCGTGRRFILRLFDRSKQEALYMTRRLACSFPLIGCYLQRIEVFEPPCTYLGCIQQKWSISGTIFSVRDMNDYEIFTIMGPSTGPCCCHYNDTIFTIFDVASTPVTSIEHQWDSKTMNYKMTVKFPFGSRLREKALLLAGGMLLEYMLFSSSKSSSLCFFNCHK